MTDQEHYVRMAASEFRRAGFRVSFFSNVIHVSLSRKVSKVEVETFLEQEFEGCSFSVKQLSDGVEVTVE